MPEPLPPVPIEDQIAEVDREVGLRYGVYKKAVAAGRMSAEDARRQIDAMRAVARTLRALGAAATPVLEAMGFAVESEGPPAEGEASGRGPMDDGAPPPEPPPSDGLEGTEPIGPGQIGELQALLVDHGWDRETTLELLARSGWERLADVPVRKLGLVRSAVADPMHRARIAEDLQQRSRRQARGSGTAAPSPQADARSAAA